MPSMRVGGVQLCGSRYFYFKITPQDQTPKLYARDGLKGKERLLADPQVLGGGGQALHHRRILSLAGRQVRRRGSRRGRRGGRRAASHQRRQRPSRSGTLSTASGAPRSAGTRATKFFYYTRLQKLGPNDSPMNKELDMAAYLHHLGDDADKDVAVLGRKFTPVMGMVPTDSRLRRPSRPARPTRSGDQPWREE